MRLGRSGGFGLRAGGLGRFAVPVALAAGGGSSEPRTPQAPSPSRAPARGRRSASPVPMLFGVKLTNISSTDRSLAQRPSQPFGAARAGTSLRPGRVGAANRSLLALRGAFSNRFRQASRHFEHVLWRGSPIACTARNRLFRAQNRENVGRYARLDGLHGLAAAAFPAANSALPPPPRCAPSTWWASRNGIFSTRTSQSARSVAVE